MAPAVTNVLRIDETMMKGGRSVLVENITIEPLHGIALSSLETFHSLIDCLMFILGRSGPRLARHLRLDDGGDGGLPRHCRTVIELLMLD